MKLSTSKIMLVGIIIGCIIGGGVVWYFAGTAVNTNNTGMMRLMGIRAFKYGTMMSAGDIDAHFIEQMIPHHEDAIVMAELALQKAQRPEVKTLAQNIIDSQEKEIEQMKKWYKDWYWRDLPTGSEVMSQHGMMGNSTGMHMGMMGSQADLERLGNAADFDREFVEEMIPHHQMAVMMASMLKNSTNRAEMQNLADAIITAQTNEIDQMREWLSVW